MPIVDGVNYPEVEGVDWNNASNRLAFAQNQGNREVDKIFNDSGDLSAINIGKILDSQLDDSTKDYLVQWVLGEKSNINAWSREMEASNTQYQRMVADLQKAGLNPFLALNGLNGSVPSSSGQSVSGGLMTSKKNSERDYKGNLMKTIALIAAALARTMVFKK